MFFVLFVFLPQYLTLSVDATVYPTTTPGRHIKNYPQQPRQPQKAWPMLFETSPKWMPQECTGDVLDNEAAIPVISIRSTTMATTNTTTTGAAGTGDMQQATMLTTTTTTTTTTLSKANDGAGGIDNIAFENN